MTVTGESVDVLAAQVREALIRGEGCCHVNDREWTREWWSARLAALGALVARVTEAERERDRAMDAAEKALALGDTAADGWARKSEALADARNALERIARNAESWHGPPGDNGHVRALGVIAGWAREVLARLDGSSE